jgi:hypothetical protein
VDGEHGLTGGAKARRRLELLASYVLFALVPGKNVRCLQYELSAWKIPLSFEVKSIELALPVHQTSEVPVGLLINFNVARLVDGVTRLVLTDRPIDKGTEQIEERR